MSYFCEYHWNPFDLNFIFNIFGFSAHPTAHPVPVNIYTKCKLKRPVSVKMVQRNRHGYFYLWLFVTFSFPNIAEMEKLPSNSKTLPTYNPRMSACVWFSTFASPIISDSMSTASSTDKDINIMHLMMPGPLGSQVAAKENNKVPKVEKILLRLK